MKINIYLVIFLCISASGRLQAADIRLKNGMVIRESARIVQDRYTINADPAGHTALVEIEGHDIVLDFNHAIVQGSNDKSRPDEFYGLAIRVRKGSRNITISNASIHGFKIAILADSVDGLTITGCDLSYNRRQHLNSNREREDISDWMSYHHNEQDEWLRYGAALYLKNTRKAVITNNIVTGGQCALMMSGCKDAQVYDNDFSFNSGIGIGLYRSSNNRIYHNRLDYNVRGSSFGKYQRGQDSAGILVFEQSSDNTFAFNSATHSGDGFFLWAGQTTMDKGTGGCNDNFIYGNDFSFAPTNGIEATFSRNLIMKNIVKGCEHGVWAGYSYDTDITDNTFEDNRVGIAIEHGQNMNIALNRFTGDKTGIRLWSREKQPDDWAYAKLRNTASMNYWIAANHFMNNHIAMDFMGTDTIVLQGNTKINVDENLVLGERTDNIDSSHEDELLDLEYQPDERLKKISATKLYTTPLTPAGKEQIRMTEWGPYDFRYPLLWLKNTDSSGLYHFEVMGPTGKWQVKETKGFHIVHAGNDSFPSVITASADPDIMDRSLQLVYTGAGFTDAFGKQQDSGTAYTFSYHEFDPHMQWETSWYRWDALHDPAKGLALFEEVFQNEPIKKTIASKVDYTWWVAIGRGLASDSFATVATTAVHLPKGVYELAVTADDYAKVFVDGKEVIDAWDSRYTERDEDTHHRVQLSLSEGEHHIRIVHAENTGLATLMFYIRPVRGMQED